MIGTKLKHYEILSKLGSGGMGEVYAALDAKLDRKVALKVLAHSAAADPEVRERFEREARTLAALNHPSIVTIYSIERADGICFLTMELVEGRTLDEEVPSGGLGLDRFFEIAVPLADALAAAHDRGVVHRDLKPRNVMIAGDGGAGGQIKVLDFGLAKLQPGPGPLGEGAPTEALTQAGGILGTVPYMSPEQLAGRPVDPRSDVFSLGVVLYELATGVHPFAAETPAEVVSSILRDRPEPVTAARPGLPRHLARIIRRCLETDPGRRYQVTLDLRNDLEDLAVEIAEGGEPGAAPPTPAARAAEERPAPAKWVRAATVAEVRTTGCKVVHLAGHTVALFSHHERIYAVDNRCPHMGFPLDRGSVKDCILTCHWHHARFDLVTGGTLDPWADDVRSFPVEVRDGEVWVDVAERRDLEAHQRVRIGEGLQRNLPLVLAKAVVLLLEDGDGEAAGVLRAGLEFGAAYRLDGWGPGLTILTCMMNLLPHLDAEDRPRALYHGLSAVADDCEGRPPRFPLRPLPEAPSDVATLQRWFRRSIEVRDAQGAERCLVSAVRSGASERQIADMLFAAATDHRYLNIGHVLDFTNKAFEALDLAGWDLAEPVLASLVPALAGGRRMEESNAWRSPVDLVPILERAFEALPTALGIGQGRRGTWSGWEALVPVLLGTDPQTTADSLLMALREGATEDELGAVVAYAAALRIAAFNTSNEFGDWDTALHTFSFANAVHQGLRRAPSPELMRGVVDAAMSIYLDRFLNVPPVPLPEPEPGAEAAALLERLPVLLDRQQQVGEAAQLVVSCLAASDDPAPLLAALGAALLREDRDFHTIQAVEAAFRHFESCRGTPAAAHPLVAAARYLAAHSPTVRSQDQTYRIAHRLHRGDALHERL